jgi:cell wall-associated NlpC family hydrolase
MRRALHIVAIVATAGCGPVGEIVTPSPFPRAPVRAPATRTAGPPAALGTSVILQTALALQGTAYRLGGADPTRGFDCSGFVRYVFAQQGIVMPRTVAEQLSVGRDVASDRIQAGDLVFFATTSSRLPTHVGIALGPASPGEFIHAPADGSVVRVEHFDTTYWRTRWVGARRPL